MMAEQKVAEKVDYLAVTKVAMLVSMMVDQMVENLVASRVE
jgi:hypothetical protein